MKRIVTKLGKLSSLNIMPNGSMSMGYSNPTIMVKKHIICMAGSSGAGKTTLAKALAHKYGKTFIEQSAGMILSDAQKEALAQQFGYHRDFGQINVINLSNSNPEFALQFQLSILEARCQLIDQNDNLILDRSPFDVLPFFLNQVVHHYDEKVAEDLISRVAQAMLPIMGVISLPYSGGREIEDNGARVSNRYFQYKMSNLYQIGFNLLSSKYDTYPAEEVEAIPFFEDIHMWDWKKRLHRSSQLVQSWTGWEPLCKDSEIPGTPISK